MIFLSPAAIDYAVNMCFEEPRYNILMVTKYHGSASAVADTIRDRLINNEYRGEITRRMTTFYFENGSLIRVISSGERIPGFRANLVVVDIGVNREALDQARSHELNDWARYNAYHREIDEFPW